MTPPSRLSVSISCVGLLAATQIGLTQLFQGSDSAVLEELSFWIAPITTPGLLLLIAGSVVASRWVSARLGVPARQPVEWLDWLAALICVLPSVVILKRHPDVTDMAAPLGTGTLATSLILVLVWIPLQAGVATYLRPDRERLWVVLSATPILVVTAVTLYLTTLQAVFGEGVTPEDVTRTGVWIGAVAGAGVLGHVGMHLGRRLRSIQPA